MLEFGNCLNAGTFNSDADGFEVWGPGYGWRKNGDSIVEMEKKKGIRDTPLFVGFGFPFGKECLVWNSSTRMGVVH